MKNKDKVAGLIAELKSLAETDFEKHRIEVLERDLTDPPKVEIVDDSHQKFDGIVYHQIKDKHFITSASIHRAVYNYYYGEIPVGYDIHHIDENKFNNDISNLQMLTKTEHMTLHGKRNFNRQEKICPICGKKFVSTKYKKTCSDVCWKKSKGIIVKCKHCGKEFLKYLKNQEYCSIGCSTAEMDANREKHKCTCIYCGKEFLATYEGALYCSQKCSNRYHYEHDREDRICVICGKTFNTFKNSKAQSCSPSCGAKLSHQNRTNKN